MKRSYAVGIAASASPSIMPGARAQADQRLMSEGLVYPKKTMPILEHGVVRASRASQEAKLFLRHRNRASTGKLVALRS
jgi:hypothetical protein